MDPKIIEDEVDITILSKNAISFIKRASRYIIISFLIGLSFGLFIYFNSAPFYKSQIGFYSDNLSDSKLFSLMSDLERFVQTNEYGTISQKLRISEKSAKRISSMKVEQIERLSDTEQEEKGIILTFTVEDNQIFDSLEPGLKHYIENTDFVKARLSSYKLSLISNIGSLSNEIKDLDSLKSTLLQTIKRGGKSNLFLSDVGNIGARIAELKEKQNNLESQLSMISDIRVFKNFSKYHKKAGPRFLITILIWIGLAEFFGIFIYLLPKIREFISNA